MLPAWSAPLWISISEEFSFEGEILSHWKEGHVQKWAYMHVLIKTVMHRSTGQRTSYMKSCFSHKIIIFHMETNPTILPD